MQLKINLPQPSKYEGTEETRSFLKQLELAVHHAQKSLQEMIKMENERGKEEPCINVLFKVICPELSGDGENDLMADYIEIELYSE